MRREKRPQRHASSGRGREGRTKKEAGGRGETLTPREPPASFEDVRGREGRNRSPYVLGLFVMSCLLLGALRWSRSLDTRTPSNGNGAIGISNQHHWTARVTSSICSGVRSVNRVGGMRRGEDLPSVIRCTTLSFMSCDRLSGKSCTRKLSRLIPGKRPS